MAVALKKALPGHLMAEADPTAMINQFMSMQEAPFQPEQAITLPVIASTSLTSDVVGVQERAELPEKPPTQYRNDLNRHPNSNKILEGDVPEDEWAVVRIEVPLDKVISQYLMESYKALTPIDFWKQYTSEETGQQLLPMEITVLLQKECQVKNLKLVQEAHAALGEDLNKYFQYCRGKDVKMMTRVWDIAWLCWEKCNGKDKENN
ncbi:hypothetical protein EDD18DRAFT_1104255 [Armillaria luteobubalina]|uniref:Uncharacterized protein n=1 Tax=Armillaria luteobubalina TaxID=153913 RepID=A0AA39UPE1_9AGAR|nr:hypothetical protein EDD18DRAFT_1104255 [Armillaria luteobubalina]